MGCNVKLTLAYDGTHYLGWQATRMGPSIESELSKVLKQIFNRDIILQAASRTDAGVHATGQIVNFLIEKETLDLQRLKYSLNSLLPDDIVVKDIEKAEENFHPTLNCVGKEYRYHLCYDVIQMPQERHFSWHYPRPLNVDLMRQAARLLEGEHDFAAFCNFKKNSNYTHYVRNVQSINIVELPGKSLQFEIRGNHFLYKMVRNLVGTIVYVGEGKIPLSAIQEILSSKHRPLAGVTAPAHGLFLHEVFY